MEEKAGESFDNLPPGYRFAPYNKELITRYLKPKINGFDLPLNPIHEVDNINVYGPEDLTARFNPQGKGKSKNWYFYTSRNKKYKNGSRPDRKAGDGFWKATGKDHPIKDDDGTLIGHQRSLVYFKGKPNHNKKDKKKENNNEKTQWHMLELRVSDDQPKVKPKRKRDHQHTNTTSMMLDYVLCRIYYNEGAKKEIKEVKVTEENKEVVKSNTEEENISSHEQEINNEKFSNSSSNTFSVTNNDYQFLGYDNYDELANSNNVISYDNNDGLINSSNLISYDINDGLVNGSNLISYDNDGLVNNNNLISYGNDGLNNSIYGDLQDLEPDFDSLYDKIMTEVLLDQIDFTY